MGRLLLSSVTERSGEREGKGRVGRSPAARLTFDLFLQEETPQGFFDDHGLG